MSKQDDRDYAKAKQQLSILRDPQALRVNDLCEKSIEYHEWIWSDKPDVVEKRREYLREHPAEFKVRWASSNMFIRIMAGSAARNRDAAPAPTRNITPEQLARMNLSPEQLAVLAGILNYEKSAEIEVEAEESKVKKQ